MRRCGAVGGSSRWHRPRCIYHARGHAQAGFVASGKQLGHPRLREIGAKGSQWNKAAAERLAANVLPIFRELQKQGIENYASIGRWARRQDSPRWPMGPCSGGCNSQSLLAVTMLAKNRLTEGSC
jgi:hypothetical protein